MSSEVLVLGVVCEDWVRVYALEDEDEDEPAGRGDEPAGREDEDATGRAWVYACESYGEA